MSKRILIVCDWCAKEQPDAAPAGWAVSVLADEHLCPECVRARSDAVEQAKLDRATAPKDDT